MIGQIIRGLGLTLWDIVRPGRAGRRLHGLTIYWGRPGSGKTLSLCLEALETRAALGSGVWIASNFGVSAQDAVLEHWRQLLEARDVPVLALLDEAQESFSSRAWRDFPPGLLSVITQRRKWGGGVRLVLATQRLSRIDIVWRELADDVVRCNMVLPRLLLQRWYDGWEWHDSSRLTRPRAYRWRFVAVTDAIREAYDTYELARVLVESQPDPALLPREVEPVVEVVADGKQKTLRRLRRRV